MNLFERAKNILLTPNTEWPVIDGEADSVGSVFTGYAMPLAAIGPIVGALGVFLLSSLFGSLLGGLVHLGIGLGLGLALLGFIMALVSVFVLGLIINALAPTFGGTPDQGRAIKLAIYSSTSSWIGSLFTFIPLLGGLIALAAWVYSIYLLYVGLPVMMKAPAEKAVGYTVVVVIAAILLWLLVSFAIGAVTTAAMVGGMARLGMH
jgi:hypothetical protein